MFSSEMLARGFLRSGDPGPEWYVGEHRNGELASLLLGPYTDLMWVLPNPLPEPLAAAEDALLNLLDRGSFVSVLSQENAAGPVELFPRRMSYDVSGDRRSRQGAEAGR